MCIESSGVIMTNNLVNLNNLIDTFFLMKKEAIKSLGIGLIKVHYSDGTCEYLKQDYK